MGGGNRAEAGRLNRLPNGTYIDRATGQRFNADKSPISNNQNQHRIIHNQNTARTNYNQGPRSTQPNHQPTQPQPTPETQKGFYKDGYIKRVGESSVSVIKIEYLWMLLAERVSLKKQRPVHQMEKQWIQIN